MNIKTYLDHLRARGWSPNTLKAYESDLSMFAAFLDRRRLRLSQVSPAVLTAFIEEMKVAENPRFGKAGFSPATIARRLAAVSRYFDFLRATSSPKLRNPVTIVNRVRLLRRQHSRAPGDQLIEKLLAGIDNTRDRAIVMLAFSSGLRLSELHQLNRDSITIEEEADATGELRRLGTGEVIGKGSKQRSFYIDAETVEALAQYLALRQDDLSPLFLSERKQRMSQRAIQYTVTAWCTKLKLPQISPHRFRHAYAERLANASIDSMVLKELMGHESFTTTTQYFKLSNQTKAREYFAAMELAKHKR